MLSSTRRCSLLVGTVCLGLALAAPMNPPVQAAGRKAPPGQAAESMNMRLVGHHDMQGRSIYKGHIQEQNGRFIAYVGHHGGSAFNPLTGVDEPLPIFVYSRRFLQEPTRASFYLGRL